MTDRPRRINYDKTPPPAADHRPPVSYVTDPEVNPYAFQEYPMPLIYDRDDDGLGETVDDYRAAHDDDYDRVSRNLGDLSARGYLILIAAVMTAAVLLVLIANLVAS